MTLSPAENIANLVIAVNSLGAIREMKAWDAQIRQSSKVLEDWKESAVSGVNRVNKAFNLLVLPSKTFVAAVGAMKAATLAAGAASITAAANYEMYRQQLLSVLGTVEKANKAFAESESFANKSPFDTENVVKARIALEQVGIKGADAVTRVAEAAAVTNKQIIDVVSAVRSLEREPLRNLGLSDKELQIITEVRDSQGFQSARMALLDTFKKYEGSMDRMAETWQGVTSTFGDAITTLRANFGEGFLVESKLVVKDMTSLVESWVPAARSSGVAFGEELEKARASILATMDMAKIIGDEIKMSVQAGHSGKVLTSAFEAGAEILGSGVVAALQVSLPIWKVIGESLYFGLLQAYYRSDVIGAESARENAIKANLASMDSSKLRALSASYGINVMQPYGAYQNLTPYALSQLSDEEAQKAFDFKNNSQLAKELTSKIIDTLSIDEQAKLATPSMESLSKDLEGLPGEFKNALMGLYAQMRATGQQFLGDISTTNWANLPVNLYNQPGNAERIYNQVMGSRRFSFEDWGKPVDMDKEWKSRYEHHLAAGKVGERAIEDTLNKEKQNPVLPAQPPVVISPAKTDATKVITQSFRELENEKNLLGLTNDERERAIKLTEVQAQAEVLYGENSREAMQVIEDYRQKLIELQDARELKAIADGIGNSFGSAFEKMAMGAASAGEAMKALLRDVEQLVIRQLITQNIADGISAGVYGMFSGWGRPANGVTSSNVPTASESIYNQHFTNPASMVTSAKGNVFYGRDLVRFASGDVYTSPHYFPMTGGRTGVTAEAGMPEAQVPLVRMPGGQLGVRSVGDSGNKSNVNVKINVENQSGQNVNMEQSGVDFDGENYIINVVMKNINTGGQLRNAMRGGN